MHAAILHTHFLLLPAAPALPLPSMYIMFCKHTYRHDSTSYFLSKLGFHSEDSLFRSSKALYKLERHAILLLCLLVVSRDCHSHCHYLPALNTCNLYSLFTNLRHLWHENFGKYTPFCKHASLLSTIFWPCSSERLNFPFWLRFLQFDPSP